MGSKAYMKEYESRPDQIKKREARNRARYQAEKAGLVHKGDGKDVDHVRPLDNGGSSAKSNTRVVSAHENRGWRQGSASYNPAKQKKGK